MINTIKHLFIVALLFIFADSFSTAEATDWSQTFIEGANSYDNDGEIKFESSARLNNAPQNGQLPAPKVDDSDKACYPDGGNAKKCKKSNQLAQLPAERVSFSQCKSSSNNNIGPPSNSNPSIDVPEGEYGDVKLEGGSNRTIRFTTEDGIYKLKTLQAKSGRLELSSGQYWIGDLEINQGVTVVFPATGTVSFFIEGGYDIVNGDSPADPTRFLIYSYDDIKLMGGVNLNAYLVGEDDVLLEGSSTLNGAVTSEEIELKGGAVINFINRTDEIDVIPDCNAEPVLPVVPLQCPAEQAGVAGITYRTYDATNWKPGQYTSPVDHDDFNDLVARVKTTINQLGESIESRIEGYGVNISPHSNQGDNYAGIFEGYLDVPETGNYTFGIDGDDSIELLIDDQVVVGFYGLHGQCGWPCRTGDIALAQGTHKIEMRFHEATGAEAYHLYWQPPSASSLVKVPESAYLTCPFPQFEFGRVSLSSGSAVINFENSYATAPVVMLMPTIDGATPTNDGPSSVRLVSSSATTVNISQNDPPGNRVSADDMPEVDYFVMESGYRFLAQGKALQAGDRKSVV